MVLLLGAVCCLFLALQWGGNNYSWHSSRVIGLLVGFCLLLVAFCVLQWWLADKATIPLRILRQRTVSYGALARFFISMSSNIVRLQFLLSQCYMQLMLVQKLYYLPFYFQAAQGLSVMDSGVRFLALAAPQVVATVMAGGLATQTGHYVSKSAQ